MLYYSLQGCESPNHVKSPSPTTTVFPETTSAPARRWSSEDGANANAKPTAAAADEGGSGGMAGEEGGDGSDGAAPERKESRVWSTYASAIFDAADAKNAGKGIHL